MYKGNLDEAESQLNLALDITIKAYGQDHSTLAIIYNTLGKIYFY